MRNWNVARAPAGRPGRLDWSTATDRRYQWRRRRRTVDDGSTRRQGDRHRVEDRHGAHSIEEAWDLGVRTLNAFGFEFINYGFTRFQHTDCDRRYRRRAVPDQSLDAEHVRSYFESGFFGTHADVPLGARATSAPNRGAGPEQAPVGAADDRGDQGDGREQADRGLRRLLDRLRADLVAVEGRHRADRAPAT